MLPSYVFCFLLIAVVIPFQVLWNFLSTDDSSQQVYCSSRGQQEPAASNASNEIVTSKSNMEPPIGHHHDTLGPEVIEKLSRVFEPKLDQQAWCPQPLQENSALPLPLDGQSVDSSLSLLHAGLLYVKNHKAASSTGAGITLRIAHNVAKRRFSSDTTSMAAIETTKRDSNVSTGTPILRCPNEYRHAYSIQKRHAHRDPTHSFLWTTVRHPAARALSAFFFFSASRGGYEVTSKTIMWALQQHKSRQVDLLAVVDRHYHRDEKEGGERGLVSNYNNATEDEIVAWIDRYVMSQYDFLAVVERLPESLVVLKNLLDIEWQDLVVLPAKQSGTWFLGHGAGGRSSSSKNVLQCVPLIKPFTTPAVDEYIATDFVDQNWDYYLYAAANRSLDRTIDFLGRSRVEQGVLHLQKLQQLAEEECLLQHAHFPCSANGTEQLEASYTSCYAEDCGCGHACVDEVLRGEE